MRNTLIIILSLLFVATYTFADNTNRWAGGATNNASFGTVAWTTPTNAVGITNLTYATATGLDNTSSQYLYVTNYGFAVPTSATINGVVVSPTRKCSNAVNLSRDTNVFLVVNSVIGTANRATATQYTTSDVTEDHGGTNDTWGFTLTPADINSPQFGTVFSSYKIAAGVGVNITVDAIKITVYYTLAGARKRKAIGQTVY